MFCHQGIYPVKQCFRRRDAAVLGFPGVSGQRLTKEEIANSCQVSSAGDGGFTEALMEGDSVPHEAALGNSCIGLDQFCPRLGFGLTEI